MLMPQKAKFYWLIWGGDLYCYQHRKKSFKNYVRYLIRKLLIKRIGNIGSYFCGEAALAKDVLDSQGNGENAFFTQAMQVMRISPKKDWYPTLTALSF